jgi:hypothetical protein
VAPPEAIERIIAAAADTLRKDTVEALTRGSVIASVEGQEHAASTLGIQLNFNLVNSYAVEKARDYRDLLRRAGGSMINGEFKPWLTDAIEADRKAVSDIVTKAISKEGGSTLRDIRKGLDEIFTQGEHNSALVAYQETRRLLNDGTFDRWKDEGITRGIYHHLPGQLDPRPEHEAMDGREVDIDDPEIRAMLDDYNCHCSVEPLIPGMAAAGGA